MDVCKCSAKRREGGMSADDTPFGVALRQLIDGIQAGATTDMLIDGCDATLKCLPVTTFADAARALDVEISALESDGPGRVWRIAVVGSVRDLLHELARAGRSADLLPADADSQLLRLEAAWLALMAEAVERADEDVGAINAAWSALLAVADAPAHGLTGVLVKLRVLLRFLADTSAAEQDTPEARLLTTTLATVERLVNDVAVAEIAAAERIDDLFIGAGKILAPLDPSPGMIEGGAQAGGVSATVARRIYDAMLGVYQRARGGV